MTESNHDNSNDGLTYADELRLKAFLRDAEAIIAAERGLNPASRRKLESLVRHHQLSDRLKKLAIQRLQNNSSRQKPLSRYEQAFSDFLDQEFGQLTGDVLSLRAEQKAIEIATTKYQLPPSRAEQLIAHRARLASLVRIAHSDAEDYAHRFLGEQVGDRLQLDDESRTNLIDCGQKLGLAPEKTIQIIDGLLAQNRRQRRFAWPHRLAILLCLILFAAGLVWTIWIWQQRPTSDHGPPHAQTTIPESEFEQLPDLEESVPWLSPGSLALIDLVEQQNSLNFELKTVFTHQDPLVRARGYRQLAEMACGPHLSDQNSDVILKLLGSFFYEEPDPDTVFALLDPLEERLQVAEMEELISIQHFKRQYRINQIIAKIYFYRSENTALLSLGSARRTQLAQRMQQASGVSPTGMLNPEYLQRAEAALAIHQWNVLLQNCWADSGNVAAVVQPLLELTRNKIAPMTIAQMRTRVLQSLLETNPSQWLNVEQPIADAIATADRTEALDWVDLVLDSQHASFQSFAAPRLQKKLNIRSRSSRLNDVLESLNRFVIDYENQKMQPLLNRSSMIETATLEFLATMSQAENPATPDRIAQVALFSNMHLAVRQQLQRGVIPTEAELFAIDDLLDKPKIRLREIVSLTEMGRTTHAPTTPTPSDLNRKNESLRQIETQADDRQNSRIRYLTELAKIAHRFDDLSYDEAQILASYFLNETSNQESLNIQQHITSFAHWPTLGLAIADQIAESTAEQDQALSITRLYWGRESSIDVTNENWREEIRSEIILWVTHDLSRKTERLNQTQSDWLRLRLFLNDLYRQRGLFYQPFGRTFTSVAAEPADILLALIATSFDANSSSVSLIRRGERVSDFIRFGSQSGLHQTVLAGQLFLELINQQNRVADDENTDSIQKLIAEIRRKNPAQVLGDRLLLMELDMLETFSKHRQSLILNR